MNGTDKVEHIQEQAAIRGVNISYEALLMPKSIDVALLSSRVISGRQRKPQLP